MAGTPQTEKPITWDWVRTALPIIVVLVGLVAAFAAIQSQAVYHETRICALESKAERTQEAFAEIQRQLAEIQRDLQYLRRDVDRQSIGEP
jgi:uncharacterized coiled-coil protein SlyX